jgi:hypothetical protein
MKDNLISRRKFLGVATVVWRNINLNPGKNHVEIKTANGTDSADLNVK